MAFPTTSRSPDSVNLSERRRATAQTSMSHAQGPMSQDATGGEVGQRLRCHAVSALRSVRMAVRRRASASSYRLFPCA
jgi:hypothetical protein